MCERKGVLVCLAAMVGLGLAAAIASAAAKGPVQVFILAGQSNMEGKATETTLDAVIADPRTHDQFKHLKTADGRWAERHDVWVTFLSKPEDPSGKSLRYGPLTVGYGSPKTVRDEHRKRVPVRTLGPELGIGYVLGDYFDQQVLLIKAAWGGRAVKFTFRPPSAMPTDQQIRQEVAAIKARDPQSPVTFESRKAQYGSDYRRILEETDKVLSDLGQYFPDYDPAQGYRLRGFIWFQGWNDAIGQGNPDYVEQMACFINDIRRDLNAPHLPFVIGQLGTDGPGAEGWIATFRKQQAAIAALPQFKGTVRLAPTAQYWPTWPDLQDKWEAFRAEARKNEAKAPDDPTRIKPGDFFQKNWVQRYKKDLAYFSDKRYHYKGSGACYYQMGQSMGRAMIELLEAAKSGQ